MRVAVPLTKGYTAFVSSADAERVLALNWYAEERPNGRVYGRARVPGGGGAKVYLHKFVLDAGADDVDHKDGDGLNCCRDNLRRASRTLNNANSQKRTGCSSQYKGVSWNKPLGKWTAQIKVGERQEYIGQFTDEVAAARAYDRRALEVFGEFARLNFPREDYL